MTLQLTEGTAAGIRAVARFIFAYGIVMAAATQSISVPSLIAIILGASFWEIGNFGEETKK